MVYIPSKDTAEARLNKDRHHIGTADRDVRKRLKFTSRPVKDRRPRVRIDSEGSVESDGEVETSSAHSVYGADHITVNNHEFAREVIEINESVLFEASMIVSMQTDASVQHQ